MSLIADTDTETDGAGLHNVGVVCGMHSKFHTFQKQRAVVGTKLRVSRSVRNKRQCDQRGGKSS
jgi:hypothetical protein